MKQKTLPIIVILSSFQYVSAQTDSVNLKLDFPLFDLPYQKDATKTVGNGFFSGYANPSMTQSLAVTTDIYSAFHYGMKELKIKNNVSKKLFGYAGVILGDLLLDYCPGGNGWLHEEYHRAIMTRFGVNSFNEMNKFPLGQELVSVNKVKDEGLEKMKSISAPDFTRMHVAGIEGQYLLIDQLQRNNFFYEQNLFHEFQYWLNALNSILYVMTSAKSKEVDVEIDKMNSKEISVAERDFTGYDMTSWTYDLFRPDEPYQYRGVHPSGIGIDRYRKTTHLNNSELNYLKRQGIWQLTNLLSPMMFGFRSINIGENGLRGNVAFRHYLTSFGTDLSLNVFLSKAKYNMVFTYHHFKNYKHLYPAIEAEFIDYSLKVNGRNKLLLSPRLILGVQPEGQSFTTSKSEILGLAACRLDFGINKMYYPYLELSSKTKGWVAGNEYINSNTSIKLGLSLRL
ncbi:MAG: hypothetical protein LBV72_00235 [Tannerella sp.]|jgi:hypothetical protein|nr:hypothetical protein [Tannerella sp.]